MYPLHPCRRTGQEEKAVEMYQRTARLDLDNYNNDTEDGLHITSMTGSWLAIVQGFANENLGRQTQLRPVPAERMDRLRLPHQLPRPSD